MPKPKAHHRASSFTLAVIWQLVALIPSIYAQTQLQSTQDDTSDACTRVPANDGSTGAPAAHFLCLSFEPLSTTTAEETFSSPASLSEQQTLSTFFSSTTIPQTFNSTSDNVVSTSTIYTTLRGIEQATSIPTPDEIQIMTNGMFSPNGTAKTILSQNLTTGSDSAMPTTSLPQHGDGGVNATMFSVVLHTVTHTTTICLSSGRI